MSNLYLHSSFAWHWYVLFLCSYFNHSNIVKLLGVCVDTEVNYIIMELMPGGDLLKFLREAKMDNVREETRWWLSTVTLFFSLHPPSLLFPPPCLPLLSSPLQGFNLLTSMEQLQVAVDVVHGCNYLEQQNFIHRDIAARNCLVSSRGSDRVVKIGGKCWSSFTRSCASRSCGC